MSVKPLTGDTAVHVNYEFLYYKCVIHVGFFTYETVPVPRKVCLKVCNIIPMSEGRLGTCGWGQRGFKGEAGKQFIQAISFRRSGHHI